MYLDLLIQLISFQALCQQSPAHDWWRAGTLPNLLAEPKAAMHGLCTAIKQRHETDNEKDWGETAILDASPHQEHTKPLLRTN